MKMTKEQSEQLQADIITYCDGLDQDLIDQLCQVVVDYSKGETSSKCENCGWESE
jgi:hypothetical protein